MIQKRISKNHAKKEGDASACWSVGHHTMKGIYIYNGISYHKPVIATTAWLSQTMACRAINACMQGHTCMHAYEYNTYIYIYIYMIVIVFLVDWLIIFLHCVHSHWRTLPNSLSIPQDQFWNGSNQALCPCILSRLQKNTCNTHLLDIMHVS